MLFWTGTTTGPVEDVNENKCHQDLAAKCCELTCVLQDNIKQDLDSPTLPTNKQSVDSNLVSHKVSYIIILRVSIHFIHHYLQIWNSKFLSVLILNQHVGNCMCKMFAVYIIQILYCINCCFFFSDSFCYSVSFYPAY